jgi:hypothetical protein
MSASPFLLMKLVDNGKAIMNDASLHTDDPWPLGTNEVSGGGYMRSLILWRATIVNGPQASADTDLMTFRGPPGTVVTHVIAWYNTGGAPMPIFGIPVMSPVTIDDTGLMTLALSYTERNGSGVAPLGVSGLTALLRAGGETELVRTRNGSVIHRATCTRTGNNFEPWYLARGLTEKQLAGLVAISNYKTCGICKPIDPELVEHARAAKDTIAEALEGDEE